jgi:hypothetical protein
VCSYKGAVLRLTRGALAPPIRKGKGGEEVLKRIVKVLAATVLMAVLLATMVSPAFAACSNGGSSGCQKTNAWWKDSKSFTAQSIDGCDRDKFRNNNGYGSGTC